jgi:hypothetical protein
MAHCVSAPRGLAVGDLRHDRLLRRFRRHCRLGQPLRHPKPHTPGRLPPEHISHHQPQQNLVLATKSTFTGFGGTSVCGVRLITRMELKGPSLASRPRVLSLSAFFQNVACGSLAHSASEAPSSRCGPERAARARGCVVLLRPSTTL